MGVKNDMNIDGDLQTFEEDSTNVNTGWGGIVIEWIDQKLGRKLVWIVCDLHIRELILRHLIIELGGPTLNNNKWSGLVKCWIVPLT